MMLTCGLYKGNLLEGSLLWEKFCEESIACTNGAVKRMEQGRDENIKTYLRWWRRETRRVPYVTFTHTMVSRTDVKYSFGLLHRFSVLGIVFICVSISTLFPCFFSSIPTYKVFFHRKTFPIVSLIVSFRRQILYAAPLECGLCKVTVLNQKGHLLRSFCV